MHWVTRYNRALRRETLDTFGTECIVFAMIDCFVGVFLVFVFFGFFCFFFFEKRVVPKFVGLFEHCRKTAESCQHLSDLVQGQNTKREVTSLRENNIHALSSSQDRLRRLSVRVCVQTGVRLGSKS